MVAAPASQAKPDLRALTGLRGLAAWLVVFYHIRSGMAGYLPQPIMDFFAKGYLAVDFFFLLSGFVIWLSYSVRFAEGGLPYTFGFLWRRVARIWPLHLFILICSLVFVAVLIATGRSHESGYPLRELPLHIFLLQNWGFTSELTWNHPAWSISTEMAAYLIFPILAVYARWDRFPTAILILFITALIAILYFFFTALGFDQLGRDIPRTGLTRCLIQFVIGTIICALWQRWRGHWRKALYCSLFGAFMMAAYIATPLPETVMIPIAFTSFLLGMAIYSEVQNNPLNNRILHYFGEISYATYLVHFMLFIAFKIVFVSDPANISPLLIALFVALTFATSAVLYHLIEKKGQRLFLQIQSSTPVALATK